MNVFIYASRDITLGKHVYSIHMHIRRIYTTVYLIAITLRECDVTPNYFLLRPMYHMGCLHEVCAHEVCAHEQ